MRRGLSPIALGLLSLLSACSYVQPYYNYAAEPDPRKQEYVLGASDVVRVNVWKNPDLSVDAIVRPDGTISLPLLGDVPAAGRSPSQLRTDIAQKLTAFVKDESATVTVTVAAINSYHFVVSGNVERSGSYNASHYLTVTEAIALAGGPNRFADAEQTIIIRPTTGAAPKRIPIDYPGILDGKKPAQDLLVLTGDVIYVP